MFSYYATKKIKEIRDFYNEELKTGGSGDSKVYVFYKYGFLQKVIDNNEEGMKK